MYNKKWLQVVWNIKLSLSNVNKTKKKRNVNIEIPKMKERTASWDLCEFWTWKQKRAIQRIRTVASNLKEEDDDDDEVRSAKRRDSELNVQSDWWGDWFWYVKGFRIATLREHARYDFGRNWLIRQRIVARRQIAARSKRLSDIDTERSRREWRPKRAVTTDNRWANCYRRLCSKNKAGDLQLQFNERRSKLVLQILWAPTCCNSKGQTTQAQQIWTATLTSRLKNAKKKKKITNLEREFADEELVECFPPDKSLCFDHVLWSAKETKMRRCRRKRATHRATAVRC